MKRIAVSEMHIIVVTQDPTFPLIHGNRQRIFSLSSRLQNAGATIHMVYLPRLERMVNHKAEFSGMAAQWNELHILRPTQQALRRTSGTYELDDWWDDAIGQTIGRICSRERISAIIVNYIFLSKSFSYVPSHVLRILDTHDKLSDRLALLKQHGAVPDFYSTTVDIEAAGLSRADLVIGITDEESDYFRTITSKPVITLGHVTEAKQAPRESVHSPMRFGFLGSSNAVNAKTIGAFLSEFFKRYPTGVANIEFYVAGSCCKFLRQWKRHACIRLLGTLTSVDQFYKSIDCVFIPFEFGTGQKIKVVEALAYGMPLIATEIGMAGIASTAIWHTCRSVGQLIERMIAISSGKETLQSLAADSAATFDIYKARNEQALAELTGRISAASLLEQ
jgi:glycosyltransferase involved in cell wall biosynthesis